MVVSKQLSSSPFPSPNYQQLLTQPLQPNTLIYTKFPVITNARHEEKTADNPAISGLTRQDAIFAHDFQDVVNDPTTTGLCKKNDIGQQNFDHLGLGASSSMTTHHLLSTKPLFKIHSSLSGPDRASNTRESMVILRTRKPATCQESLKPRIFITLQLLDTLRGLSLPHAARVVGVSATAFKRACRRLGVLRWDFRRGPGRVSSRQSGISSTASFGSAEAGRESLDVVDAAFPETEFTASFIDGMEATETELAKLPDEMIETDSEGSVADDALVLEMLARPW